MNIIAWIIFGLITGVIANLLDPVPEQGGFTGSIILGILGAILGGFISSIIFGVGISGFNISSLIIAISGSLVLLYITRLVRGSEKY